MAVRVADTLKQQNNLKTFPVAYAEDIWVKIGQDSDAQFKTLQELYALGSLAGGGQSSTYELSFDESSAELTIAFN